MSWEKASWGFDLLALWLLLSTLVLRSFAFLTGGIDVSDTMIKSPSSWEDMGMVSDEMNVNITSLIT